METEGYRERGEPISDSWKWVVDDFRARFERSDGAYVLETRNFYYTNPLDPEARLWEMFRPNDVVVGFSRKNTSFRIPYRYKTAQSAMRSLDRLLPLRR